MGIMIESSRRNFSAGLPVSFEISPATQVTLVIPLGGQSRRDSCFRALNLNFIIFICMISGEQAPMCRADKDNWLGFCVEEVVGDRCEGCVGCYYYF